MVCAKCQKFQKRTELATPGVKRKNDMYFGSSASNDKSKSSSTSNASGIGKVLLRAISYCCVASLIVFSHRANSSAKVLSTLTAPHVLRARQKYVQIHCRGEEVLLIKAK